MDRNWTVYKRKRPGYLPHQAVTAEAPPLPRPLHLQQTRTVEIRMLWGTEPKEMLGPVDGMREPRKGMARARQWGDRSFCRSVSACWPRKRALSWNRIKPNNKTSKLLKGNHGVGTKLINIAICFWIILLKSQSSQLRRNGQFKLNISEFLWSAFL